MRRSPQVCYCGGACWAMEHWVEVPGELAVERSAFSFALVGDPPAATDRALSLRVSRPAFSGVSDKDTWKLKVTLFLIPSMLSFLSLKFYHDIFSNALFLFRLA